MKANELLAWFAGAALAIGLSTLGVDVDRAKRCHTVAMYNRDNTGTTTCPETTNSSPTRGFSMSASRQNLKAEGTGLEPATGCPAPEFQSGR